MGVYVYVGNLGESTTEDAIRSAFEARGTKVKSVSLMRSSTKDRSRGFGFVEVGTEEEAEAVKSSMNGVEVEGRPLKVDTARAPAGRPRTTRGFGSFDGFSGRTGKTKRPSGGSRRRR